jgi:hypothetical protein
MSSVKIPKQLYVVSMKLTEREYSKPDYDTYTETVSNFGFLHPHEPNLKADAKRKDTQNEWAYNRGYSYNNKVYQTETGEWYTKGYRFQYVPGQQTVRVDFDEQIPTEYAPKVWDNEPLTGFMIVDTVNRYRGNKLFKVLDPRGIQFEVTVASLFEIIQHGTIDHGLIVDRCVWKGNKNLVIAK